MDKYATQIRAKVLQAIDLSKEISDEEMEMLISKEVALLSETEHFSIADRAKLEQIAFNSLRKLDVISELVEDESVTEIMVNGPHKIFYEKGGRLYRFEGSFASEERLEDIMQQIVADHNRVINLASPIVDTRLKDGSRVNMVIAPVAVDGSVLTIRKFPKNPFTMEQLIGMGTITEEAAELLRKLVRAKYSMIIVGSTGSGKTTFLNSLSAFIPSDERIITIEDSAELNLMGIDNLVRLETRNANLEGVSEVTIRHLIRTALRMRPDRIIVGECRGAEAFDMLSAFTTGHDGSLTSIHANSCKDAISRLETMVLMGIELPIEAIDRLIVSGVQILVFIGRLRDKSRRVLEIAELCQDANAKLSQNVLYRFVEEGEEKGRVTGNLKAIGKLQDTKRLMDAGIVEREQHLDEL